MWPVIDDASDKSLDVAELGVDTQNEKHDEEDDGPDDGSGQVEDEVGVRQEDEAGAGVDHVVDGRLLDVGHVPQDGEDQDAGQQAGQRVDDASNDGVPAIKEENIMLKNDVSKCICEA